MRALIGTYRLQLTPAFGFADVAGLAAYLSDLGVSHVYLSPILQSAPDSQHGYDTIDHSRIRAEFGGERAFREMAGTLAAHGLGIVLDIVPNHMATYGAAFTDVQRHGQRSEYAKWFDIDWKDGNIAGYRRFFDVSHLVALNTGDPEVFAATHGVILEHLDLIDGIRIDHPDGLADPRDYLVRLRAAASGKWIVVEKILVGEERLPDDWACDGTSGYDALNKVGGLFVDPAGAEPLISAFVDRTGITATYPEISRQSRKEVIDLSFRPELGRLAGAPDQNHGDPVVFTWLLSRMPVYRAYIRPGEPPPEESLRQLRAAGADGPLLERLTAGPAELITRFQQTSGPVMAKGVEDTAFYRWFPLVSLNEVGGEPDRFGTATAEFHDFCVRLARDWPRTMTTLSTHDTKRSEDVRARIAVISEIPDEWLDNVAEWSKRVNFDPLLDYFAWQNLMGAWPISAERFAAFLHKAAREAKTATSWVHPDTAYENGLRDFAHRAIHLCGADVARFTSRIDRYAMVNSAGARLVQLMMPGVPDVYQGNELTDFSLVDPDNRRPVDFGRRRNMLNNLDDLDTPYNWDELKLLVTARALHVRRRIGGAQPYKPVETGTDHAFAFQRGPAIAVATRLPAGLARRGGFGDAALDLPAGEWRDVLTERPATGRLADLLGTYPVALLMLGGRGG